MNILKRFLEKYLKFAKPNQSSSGFTLLEILLAIFISGFVLAGAGSGLVTILNADKKAEAKTEQRTQLNRALDFISEDIRTSRTAEIATTTTTNDTLRLKYYPDPNSATPINIDYVLENATNPWRGPKVLKRKKGSGDWQVLVDSISENTFSLTCGSGVFTNKNGFQACIDANANSRGVNINKINISLHGELSDFTGSDANSAVLSVSSRTFSRSIEPLLQLTAPSLTLTRSDGNVLVEWSTAIGGTGNYTYNIFRCQNTSCTPTSYLTNRTSIYTDTNAIAAGQTFCYYVQVNDTANTKNSDTKCITYSPLVPPTLSLAEAASSTINLTWSGTSGGIPTYKYDIWRCQENPIGTACTPTSYLTNQTSVYTDTSSLDSGEKWCYFVKTSDSDTTPDTINSSTQCLTLGALNPPTLTLSRTVRNIALDWTPATGGTGPYTYDILRCVGSSCTPASYLTNRTSIYTDTNAITAGQTVCYQVKVTATIGGNATSTPQCVTYDNVVAPNITLVINSNKVQVSWATATGGTPSYTYNLKRCTTGSTCTTASYQTNVTSPYTETSDIPANATWCYDVVVTDSDTNTDTSTKQCKTNTVALVAPPLTTQIVEPSNNQFFVRSSWDAATGGTGTYTYTLLRCTTSSCTPDPNVAYANNPTSPYTPNDKINNNQIQCFQIKVSDGSNTVLSNTSCQSR